MAEDQATKRVAGGFAGEPRASERTSFACASATTLLSGLGLLGWLTPWRGLASLNPASIPMAPSTALVLLLLGGTLMREARRRSPRLTTAVSLLVSLFACVQLVTFLAGLAPTLDALFVPDPDMFGGVPTGRISPWTALGLLLASLSLLFIRLAHGHRALGVAAGTLAFAVCLLGVVVTLGYLFGSPLLYGGTVIPVASSTALAVGCLGVALVGLTPRDSALLRPFTGSSARARLLRAVVPVVPTVVVANLLFAQVEGRITPALHAPLTALVSAFMVAVVVVYAARGVGLELDRAQAEREDSRRDTDRLAAIVQSSSDAIYARSSDGTIVAWNAGATRLFGYTPDEALGQSAILMPPGAEQELSETFEGISGGECIEHKEATRARKDGSLVLVSVSESPLRDASGQVVGVSVIARDVSEQRRGEAALLESERRLRALANSDMVGFVVGDSSGGLDANDEFLRITGYSREDLGAGRLRWAQITPPEFRQSDEAAATEVLARGSCRPYEKQFVRKDGTRVWVLVGHALVDRERERSVGFVLDIDARKHSEEELRRSEERFARVFQSSLIAIGISEVSSGRFVDVNDRWAEFLGYTRDEIIGRTALDLGLWAHLADRERLFAGLSAGHSISSGEATFRCKSGRIRSALVSMEALTLAGMAEPLNLLALVDLTERKQLEAQLLQAQKLEAVGRLAGGVAHDFNNSLGVILGFTELLMRHASGAQRGKLEQILKATQHASSLTRQLLAFSRKQVADPKVLDLNTLLSDLEKMLGRLIGEDVELALVPGADLGQVRADPGQLEQVVMNLCVNARDAMRDGGLLRIETANAELDEGHFARHEPMTPGRYVMLAVSDAGCGIEKENLSKIFEPFFTTKEQGKGTGLGLAIVYGIVKQAGGCVWVYSEPGQGTTFKIYLPRIDEPAGAPAALAPPMPSKGWETILLVEDEGPLRAIAREILEEHGYQVVEAASPHEALQIVDGHPGPIHLILTDVVMPGMSGRTMAQLLVAARPELRVLYMSGYTDDVIAHRGILEPGTLLLAKPFTARALLERVRKALDARGPGENA